MNWFAPIPGQYQDQTRGGNGLEKKKKNEDHQNYDRDSFYLCYVTIKKRLYRRNEQEWTDLLQFQVNTKQDQTCEGNWLENRKRCFMSSAAEDLHHFTETKVTRANKVMFY
jgi:hypothetical protein